MENTPTPDRQTDRQTQRVCDLTGDNTCHIYLCVLKAIREEISIWRYGAALEYAITLDLCFSQDMSN